MKGSIRQQDGSENVGMKRGGVASMNGNRNKNSITEKSLLLVPSLTHTSTPTPTRY